MTICAHQTSWTLTQELDDVGFSIGGGLWGFGLPAGEIIANVSGEARWATYVMESDFLPSDFVNCTGLRFCLANGAAPLRWVQNTNAEVDAKNHVYEGRAGIQRSAAQGRPGIPGPLDQPGGSTAPSIRPSTRAIPGRSDSTGRSSIRCGSAAPIRPTIRAPNLNDLYQPAGVTSTGFQDRLTGGSSQGMRLVSRGNPDLTPEDGEDVTRWASC